MRCAACGQENPGRAKFCLECGTPLTAAVPAAGSRESRRTVTVVFADMVGFTTLGERLDQESLRRVMDRFYDEMRAAIEAQSGTLAKFIGDAVLAVWGTPEVREDDALRAVRAADAMRGALAGLNEDLEARWDVRVGMRTGVNTGEVVVDPTRPADLLVGDTLNVAARLEQSAADGEVLIGPDTYRLVRDHVVLESVEPLALKGKAKPMPAWRVIDCTRPERRAEGRLQAPLVGRAEELVALRAGFDAVVASGACRMTTVIGSPGLGKTRLVAEFVRSVGDEAIVLQGRCQATGEGITFQPVAEVLRAAAEIDDDETPEAAREKLAAVLPENEPDRDRIVAGAAALLGLAPVASTEETFWAVRRILEALSRDRPVVLVHDDIHWGQPTFLDLLEHFVEWIRDAPVFVLALARPELREVRPRLAEPDGLAEVLGLEPLDAAGSQALVTGLLGDTDLPAGLAQRILETTEGNPLFLSETLRMLADEGFLHREGDTWVAGDMADVAVPPTIHALLSARIERLESDERSVVERASVIGHSFYRGAVSELAPAAVRPSVDGALETLSRKELVRPEDEWWLDEQVFRFHHVLIRDAAYRSLLKEARAELHERFAGWLETKAGELAGEHEEVIAFHLEQAHAYRLELGPLDEPGRLLAGRAAQRLHSAGCRALAREDLPAAVNLLKRALAPMASDTAQRLEVLVDLAEALLSAGDTGAAEQVVEELGLGADELGDERLRARATVFATQLDNLTGAGHVRESADAAASAAETLFAAGDRSGEAKAHQVVAQAEALLGQVAAAEAALDRALVAARAADDRRRITAVLSGAPRAALWGPAPIVRASGRCLDVVRILRMTPGNRHVEAAALRSQAVLEAMRGRADAARGILETCRMTLEELGLTLELHETAIHAGLVALLDGDPAAAEQHLRGAHDGFRALGVEGAAAQAASLLARALAQQGRDDEALEAVAFAEQHGGEDLKTTATWLGVRAEILSRRGEQGEALALARRAVELTHPTDALADKADALMTLATVESAAGDTAAAHASAEHAREHYAAKDHSVGVERAEQVLGTSGASAEPARGENHEEGAESRAERLASTPVGRAHLRFLDVFNRRDWTGLSDLYTPDYVQVDRRAVGWDPLEGPQAVVALMQSWVAAIPDARAENQRIYTMDDRVLAGVFGGGGSSADGLVGEIMLGFVCRLRDGRFELLESYDPDDRETILARAEELRAGLDPASVARRRRLVECANTRNYDGMNDLLAPDYLVIDTRQIGWPPWGRAEFIENHRSALGLDPDYRVSHRVVAAGDSIVADVLTFEGVSPEGAQWDVTFGAVELGGDVAVYGEVWDPDDDAALIERVEDIRALAPSATSGACPEVAWARLIRGYNARDWDAVRAVLDAELVVVDHRPVGWEDVHSADAYVDFLRSTLTGAPDNHMRIAKVLARTERAIAGITVNAGVGDGGVVFTILVGQILLLGRDGRIERTEFWAPEDEAAIRARFAELTKTDPGADAARAELTPTQRIAARAWREAFEQRDWDRLARFYAPDVIFRDLRTGLRSELRGRAAVVATLMEAVPINARITDWRPIRVVSEWVMAFTHVLGGEADGGGPWEIVHEQVTWADSRLRIGVIEIYEGRAALNQRLDGLAADPPPSLPERHSARFSAAFAARDWDGIASLFAPSSSLDDRRSGVVQEAGAPEGFVAILKSYVEQSSDVAWAIESVATIGEQVAVTRSVITGTDVSGGTFELRGLNAVEFDEEGRQLRIVVFDDDQLDEAMACMESLADSHALVLAPWVEASDQTERIREWVAAFNRHDLAAMIALQAPGAGIEDHRPGIRGPIDADDIWAWLVEEIPDVRVEALVLQDAGSVTHVRLRCACREKQDVIELDDVVQARGGLGIQSDLYEVDDPAAAARFDELAALAEPGEFDAWAAMHGEHVRRYPEIFTAGGVEQAVVDMYSADLVFRDHRPVGTMGPLDHRGYLDQMRSIAATLELRSAELHIIQTDGRLRLARSVVKAAAVPEGFLTEFETWYVTVLDAEGRVGEQNLFADEASARGWWRHQRQVEDSLRAWTAKDKAAIRALLHEDFQQEDLRSGTLSPAAGPEAFMSVVQSIFDLTPDVEQSQRLLAIEGDQRVARVDWRGHLAAGGGEMAITFFVRAADRDGKILFNELYSDEESALAALSDVAIPPADAAVTTQTGGGGARSPVARMYAEVERAFNECDWEVHAKVLRADYWWVDFRPGLRAETRSRDEFTALLRTMREGTDLRWHQTHLEERADGMVGLARVVQTGSYRGGPYEIPFLVINAMDEDGRSYFAEMFADEDPEATRRLDQLGEHHRLSNEFRRAINERDYDGLRGILADDFQQRDHRALGADDIESAEAFVASMANIVNTVPNARLRLDLVVVVGDRHVTRFGWSGHDPHGGGLGEVEIWGVGRVAEGRAASMHLYESEQDARAALREDVEGTRSSPANHPEGARWQRHAEAVAAVRTAILANDEAGLRSLMAPGFQQVDHRLAGAPTIGTCDDFVAGIATLHDMVVDLGADIELLEVVDDQRRVVRFRYHGHAPERDGGGLLELVFFAATVMQDGRVIRSDIHPMQEAASAALRSEPPPSTVEHLYATVERGFNECDWAAYAEVIREDYSWTDHRPGLRVGTESREAFVAMLRDMREGSDLRWRHAELKERIGGRVSMARVVQSGTYRGGSYEIPFLVINVLDDDGLAYLAESWAEDDPAAWQRLEDLALHHGLSNSMRDALNRRDFDALPPLIAEDFRQEDRRSIGAEPLTSRTDYLGMLRLVVEAVPDIRNRMEVRSVAGNYRVTHQHWSGHAIDGGGAIEVEVWAVGEIADGVNVRSIVFGSESEARACFEELSARDS